MNPKVMELLIDGALAVIEAAKIIAPALLASKAAKSTAFRELAAEVTKSVAEPTETELEEDRARRRVGGGT
ncbi:MAG: hypothetical protein IT379_39340 [Deltaproteobacteria bacterium]|nr:hypothetical protein [Deltaproteobacteria bacterium]